MNRGVARNVFKIVPVRENNQKLTVMRKELCL